MRDTIKGVVLGALVAAGVSVLLAQSATWTTPRNWATDDLLTAADFNAQFRDNLLWLRQDAQLSGTDALEDLGCGTLGTNEVLFSDCTWATIPAPPAITIAALGCSGTASSTTVLFGDCRWDDIPATTVVALDMGDTTTTASTFQTIGPSASLAATIGQTISVYLSALIVSASNTQCEYRVYNSTTATALNTFTRGPGFYTATALQFDDSSPSITSANTYVYQLRRTSANGSCRSFAFQEPTGNNRGFIAVVT